MHVHKPSALIVDPDMDVAALAGAILNDDGFLATILTDIESIREVAARLEPDVVLIDIKGFSDQAAMDAVAWLHQLPTPIPVIMFTTSEKLAQTVGVTFAGRMFAGVLRKPFDLQQLTSTLHEAVAKRVTLPKVSHTKPSPSISDLLRQRGVKDIQSDPDREWVTFRDKQGAEVQIYWWEQADIYCITRMKPDAERLEDLGRTDTAIEAVERALSGV